MKLNWKREILPACLFVAALIAGVYYYPILPKVVPSHFGMGGQPNGWMSKTSFLLISLGQFAFIYLLLTFLPFIDPLKKKVAPRYNVVLLFRDATLLFMSVMFLISLVAARDGMLSVDLPQILVGLVIAVLGNFTPKMPQNWFFGIRTPWALSSEIVWKKTNILGGWLLTLSGIFWIVCAALKLSIWIPLALLIMVSVWTYIYSYLLYKRLERSGKLTEEKRSDEIGNP